MTTNSKITITNYEPVLHVLETCYRPVFLTFLCGKSVCVQMGKHHSNEIMDCL